MYRRLLSVAIGTAFVSTAAVWAYYGAVPLGIVASPRGLLVWFSAAFLLATGIAWIGYWLALRAVGIAPRAFRWALLLMVAATLVMLLAEWATTWPDRAVPRLAATPPHLLVV